MAYPKAVAHFAEGEWSSVKSPVECSEGWDELGAQTTPRRVDRLRPRRGYEGAGSRTLLLGYQGIRMLKTSKNEGCN